MGSVRFRARLDPNLRMPYALPMLKRLQVAQSSDVAANDRAPARLKFTPFRDVPFAPSLLPLDQLHARAAALAEELEADRTHLVTTQAVLLEIGNGSPRSRHRSARSTRAEASSRRASKRSAQQMISPGKSRREAWIPPSTNWYAAL